MASKTPLQFIKTDLSKLESVTLGALYFLTDTNMLAVGVGNDTSTGLQYFSGVRNADFDSSTKILTIVKPDGEEFELNFSDVASAEGVNTLLVALRKDINLDTSVLGTSTEEHTAGKYTFTAGEDVSYIQGSQTVRDSLVLLDKGIQDAMENAGVTSFGEMKGAISVAGDSSDNVDGSIVFAMDGSTLTGTVYGIKNSAFIGMYNPNAADISVASANDGSIATVGQIKTYIDAQDTSLYNRLVGDPSTDTSIANTIWGSKNYTQEVENYTQEVEEHLVEVEHVTAAALTDLDERLKNAIAGGVNDVKIDGTSVKDPSTATANLYTDSSYDASSNKLATVTTVTSKIDAIQGAGLAVDASGNVTVTTQAEGDNSTNIATTAFVKRAITTEDASIAKWFNTADISTGGDVADSSLTKVSQVKKYVTDYINSLDGTATIATVAADDVITLKTGLTETDGKIANSSTSDIVLAKVAKTGTAKDVAYADSSNIYTATNVEDALTEVRLLADSLVGGMRYNGDVSTGILTVNATTKDIRPGDTYIATAEFTVTGISTIEPGDLIVYKGKDSSVNVSMSSSNVTVIERETDDMVTAASTLTSDHVILGVGNKGVKVSEITDASLKEAVNGVKAITGETALSDTNGYVQVAVTATPRTDTRDVSLSTSIHTTICDVSTAAADASGLATAYNVQQYVQDVFSWTRFE